MKKRRLTAMPLALLLASAMLLAGCSGDKGGEDKASQTETATQRSTVSTKDTSSDITTADASTADDTAADTQDTPPVTQTPVVQPPVTQTPEPPVTQPPVTQAPVQTPEPQKADALEFSGGTVTVHFEGGSKIAIGVAADDVIPALGQYRDKSEAPSCVHPGNDVLYYYDGYTVMTSPDASGRNIVAGVEINTAAVKLANGIAVGSTADAVKAAFGGGYTDVFGLINYDLTGANGGTPCSLSFACIDGPVESIAVSIVMG